MAHLKAVQPSTELRSILLVGLVQFSASESAGFVSLKMGCTGAVKLITTAICMGGKQLMIRLDHMLTAVLFGSGNYRYII